MTKNAWATSAIDREYERETVMMSGAYTRSGAMAAKRAASRATSCASRCSRRSSRASRQAVVATSPMDATSSANGACASSTSCRRSMCGTCVRYQRASCSTIVSTPVIRSAWTSFDTTRSSFSTASHGSRALLTSRATMNARATSSAARPGLGADPRHERDAHRVDDVVRDDRRDELAPQRVRGQQVAEALDDGRREVVGAASRVEVGVVGERLEASTLLAQAAAWRRRAARTARAAPCPARGAGARPSARLRRQELDRAARAGPPASSRSSGPRRPRSAARDTAVSWRQDLHLQVVVVEHVARRRRPPRSASSSSRCLQRQLAGLDRQCRAGS